MVIYNSNLTIEELLAENIEIGPEVQIGINVKIHRGCKILGDSVVGDNCEIVNGSLVSNSILDKGVKVLSSYVEDSQIGEKTTVGPFATIKKGAKIGAECRIGNFVEIKNSKLGNNTKVAHLSYIGDSELGCGCNVGCGVVFCNYNGHLKQKSIVGNNVFIGSNVNIIAPVNIGDCVYIAAGSTINKDIIDNQFAIARSKQINKNNFKNPYLEQKNGENS